MQQPIANSQPQHSTAVARRQRGFSVVELMLALALGLLVVTGIVNLFVGNAQTYRILNGQARLQENSRFAFEFITRTARGAGYFGCAPELGNIINTLNAPDWNNKPEYNLSRPVEGFEGNADGTWSPGLGALPRTVGGASSNVYIAGNGIDTDEVVEGTDVLVLRGIRQPSRRLTQTLGPLDDPVVEAPGNASDFAVDDIVLVADCEQGALLRVTGVAVAANEATLTHATGAGLYQNAVNVPNPNGTGTVARRLSNIGQSYDSETTVSVVQTDIFFIAPSAGLDNQGNTPNALWRKSGSAAPQELIAGVDDLQVQYGVDTTLNDGTTNANQYVDFDDVPDVQQIVSLRVSLDVNSVDAVTDDADQLRRTYTKTVLLRNASPEA